MEIFRLFGSVFIENDKANKSLDDTDKKGQGVAKSLGSMIGTAAKVGAGIAAGVGVAAGAMFGLATKTAEAADYIDKLSERTGINREELQRWKYAAGQSGADIGKLETGIKKLSDTMDGAANGSAASTAAFGKLGISMNDLQKKSQEQIFEEVMYALAEMPQGAERNALGNDLLGKSYTELMPLLNAGADGMTDLKNRADELGLVMSEDAVKAGVKFGDTMDDLKGAFGAVFTNLGTELIPIFQALADWILHYMPQIKSITHAAFDTINRIVTTVYNVFRDNILPILSDLFGWSEENTPTLQGFFETAFNAIKEVLKVVWDFIDKNILPIYQMMFDWVAENAPVIRETFETAFSAINDVLTKVWDFVKVELLPIFVSYTAYIQEKMPEIQSIMETVFGIIKTAVEIVWDIFANFLLPALKKLWEFVEPTFPLIGSVIKGAFDTVVTIVQTVVDVFDKVTRAIKNALKALREWREEYDAEQDGDFTDGGDGDGGGGTGGFASGTNDAPGGWSWVGEKGPEKMYVPPHSKIIPNDELGGLGKQITLNIVQNIKDKATADYATNSIVRTLQGRGLGAAFR